MGDLFKIKQWWGEDGVYYETFELANVGHDFGPWIKFVNGKYYFESGEIKTEAEVNKRAWELHRQKCDFHKDVTKRPKD